jgi:DNA polymerase III psi subunit
VPRALFAATINAAHKVPYHTVVEGREEADIQGDPAIRAAFVVSAPIDDDDRDFLMRAVAQGLRWRWEEIVILTLDKQGDLPSGVPIVVCGSVMVGGSAGDQTHGADIISTVSLADARQSRDAKRRFWGDLQRLLSDKG